MRIGTIVLILLGATTCCNGTDNSKSNVNSRQKTTSKKNTPPPIAVKMSRLMKAGSKYKPKKKRSVQIKQGPLYKKLDPEIAEKFKRKTGCLSPRGVGDLFFLPESVYS